MEVTATVQKYRAHLDTDRNVTRESLIHEFRVTFTEADNQPVNNLMLPKWGVVLQSLLADLRQEIDGVTWKRDHLQIVTFPTTQNAGYGSFHMYQVIIPGTLELLQGIRGFMAACLPCGDV